MVANQRLQQARKKRGWSKATLAKALGTTAATVEQWEQGLLIPSRSFQEALCLLFGMQPESLGFPPVADNKELGTGTSFLLLPNYNSTALSPPTGDDAPVFVGVYDPALPLPSIYANELIGRDSLLQQCRQQVLTQHCLALYGSPGIGKTALAVALAHDNEIRAQFTDGVLWAALGVHPHIPSILSRWGTLLGVTTRERETRNQKEDRLQSLRNTIGERRMLLVLDDVWQKESAEALRLDSTHCAYILTTRFAHIASHLAASKAIQVPELEEDDGVNLLARFAPTILQERDTALTLVREVGGQPLALTLMGKYLGSSAYTRQPRRVHTALAHLRNAEQRLQLRIPHAPLERLSPLSEGIDISIQSVIAVSYQHLPALARQALCAFAVLPAKPARVTKETALAVTGVSVKELDMLCDAGLLEQSGTNEYMIHTIIADYARTQAADPEASARLARYGINFIESHHTDVAALERESTVLLAALEKAWDLGWQAELIQGSCLIAGFLLHYGWYALAEQVLQRALVAAIQSDDRQGQVHILEHLSSLAHLQGNYEQATAHARKGLSLADQSGDQALISRLLTILGVVAHERGDYEQAQEHYQEGLILARQLGDQQQIGTLLKNLGVVAKKHGDYALAETYYQEGLTLARQIGHDDLTSLLLMNLGVIANERGDYLQAETYYQEGLALARQLRYRERICVLLSNLSVVADARGDYTQAETFLSEGLSLARQLGHRERISLVLLNLGVVANRQGKDTQAEAYYQEGLTLARQLGHRERMSLFLLNLGDVALEQGHLAQAKTYLEEGLDLARQIGHPERISDLLLRLGTLAAKQNVTDQAAACYQEGLALARQIGLPQLICRHLAAWGDLYLQLQQKEAAQRAFREMLSLVPEGNQTLIAHAQYGLARVAAAQGQLSEARSLAGSSSATFEALGHRQRNVVHDFLESLSGHS
ncbi:MAG TPA: tetratricopeptide repeat protein [Ktedonobacteraceae bacterium]|nr:tetratricopeptide repeat protein [Ktedonobacteraceae bacterium]